MSVPSSAFAQQFLPVTGIVNARDLGGYRVGENKQVRSGLLIRAAHLGEATDKDIAYLESLPLAKVIDLRMDSEKLGVQDRSVPGSQYVALPIDATGSAMNDLSDKDKKKFISKKKFDLHKFIVMVAFKKQAREIAAQMYPILLLTPNCQNQFREFFRQILDTPRGAVIYHCSQGKDRTGIASALLLAALGADRETIVADFDATNRVYEADVKKFSRRVRFLGGKEKQVAVVKAFIGANTENFIKALDEVDTQYGSLEAYLRGPVGLTDEDISLLRARYLQECS